MVARRLALRLTAVVAAASLSMCSAFVGPMAGSSLLGQRSSAVSRLSSASAPLTRAHTGLSALSMKVFDWKRREALAADPAVGDMSEGEFGFLGNLSPAPGSKRSKTRKGRGISAGQGATCGFGMRGQKSRSGRPTRPGFEGGQMPLYRRLPKFVGRPMGPGHVKANYGLLKLSVLNSCAANSEVTYESCLEAGLMTKLRIKKGTSVIRGKQLVKVIGCNDENREPVKLNVQGLTVKAHAFTANAVEQIQANGGKCVLLNPVTGAPIEA
mmetsp:Transcript_15223/g.37136  ORF Transcript_15223/g.37136 Transcript_15223/m.37136 type:complete len:269 (-) Transcript_15223:358-1164(-)|eukprot:CAMPEP_0206213020 /NCGR_PEP_ID=MMETSP0047_2-20121206/901_1 /ASSEMBLY_ACC=CAM_ASM_000192 /TAXON_ID=195065 /ORGANISM="Chroomonas mesostigmatica_cf, Strain CCMP1168" /LENGTH=268 /DNA_ID=CAMNT_0053635145 /DNA_START=6 /DNA_END=812 /DNA_ORIENTATION=+